MTSFRRALAFSSMTVLAMTTGGAAQSGPKPESGTLVYVGTYTGPKTTSKGIYAFRFDERSGRLTPAGLAAETRNPSFLALHPSKPFLYAVNEVDDVDADKSGGVTAFAVDRDTGKLTEIGAQSSRGADPCYIIVDAHGRTAIVANYSAGNLAVLPVGDDGRLGPASQVVQHRGGSVNQARQKGPHAHSVDLDASEMFAVSADLGADKLFVYRYDGGRLTPNLIPATAAEPGAGPRHFVFHPAGTLGFAINEIASTIAAYAWDNRRGTLTLRETVSTLPNGYTRENSTAEIRLHPGGRFLYGSNRGHDSIAVFRVADSGHLTLVEHELTRGKQPRHFSISPNGEWLIAANQGSNTLAVFKIDLRTGALSPVGPLVTAAAPVCVVFAAGPM